MNLDEDFFDVHATAYLITQSPVLTMVFLQLVWDGQAPEQLPGATVASAAHPAGREIISSKPHGSTEAPERQRYDVRHSPKRRASLTTDSEGSQASLEDDISGSRGMQELAASAARQIQRAQLRRSPALSAASAAVQAWQSWDATDVYLSVLYGTVALIGAEMVALGAW